MVSAVLNKCVDWWRERDPEWIARQARRQKEREREGQERQAAQARQKAAREREAQEWQTEQAQLKEERERKEQERQAEQARLEEEKRLINRARKAEKAALAFAIATKDSELENAGEITVMFSGCGTATTLGKHAKVSRETIDRIDGDREAAELCYIAHGFVCVAEQGEGYRTRLFSATGDDVITADALAFWGKYPKAFPRLDTFFYNRYKADPMIDIVKERRIAVGELPPGITLCLSAAPARARSAAISTSLPMWKVSARASSK